MSSTAAPTKATGKKEKAAKASSTKAAVPPSHPPYFQMIKEALLALHERSGSSPYAIAKHMEEKHKADLPSNFKKILGLQLKKNVASGKLIKIKASYKLSESGKKEIPEKKKKPQKPAAAPKKKAEGAKKKSEGEKKKPVVAKKKPEAAKKKPDAAEKKGDAAKKAEVGKKVVKVAKKVGVQKTKKATPVKPKTKQPKSVKSPAKKANKA